MCRGSTAIFLLPLHVYRMCLCFPCAVTTKKTVTARLYVDFDSIAKRVWQDDLVTVQGDCKNDFHVLGIPFVE